MTVCVTIMAGDSDWLIQGVMSQLYAITMYTKAICYDVTIK